MDGTRFDDLVHELMSGASRRRLFLRLSALPLAGGLAAFLLDDHASEAKKRKNKNKKRKNKKKKRKKKATCSGGDVCARGCRFSSVQDAIDDADPGATITICAGTFTGNLTIDKDLTLIGAGEDTTTLQGDGTPFTSVVTIEAGTVNFQDLRITGGTGDFGGGIQNAGTLQVTGCTITGNKSENFGGGIYNTGTLTVDDCTISENVPDAGGDLWGAAIYNEGTLSVTNSALTGNRGNQGGGLYSENGGPVTLTGCDISDNMTFDGFGTSSGGAIHYSGDAGLEVADCTIRDNSTDGNGGAAYVVSAAVFTNCDISVNEASSGGGIYNAGSDAELMLDNTNVTGNFSFSQGGGIYNFDGTVNLDGATVSENTASLNGGGIYNSDGTVSCDNDSTVSGNTVGNCVDADGGSGCNTCPS